MEKVIPIVLAANDNYAPYLGVTISSIVNNSSDKYYYKLHVLSRDISSRNIEKIKKMEKENISIEFCSVSEKMKGYEIKTVNHLSQETAYRLLIGQLFPEYDKVLYLDSDIIIRRDVAELYNIDLEDCILGASLASIMKGYKEYINNELHMDISGFFNAGILLINVDKFRKLKIGEKGLEMLSKNRFVCQDQDVLNILCSNQVKYIDGHWNVEWEYLTGIAGAPVIDSVREGMLEYVNDPFIIHYTSGCKPWSNPDIKLAEYFWDEARKTEYYEEILFRNFVKNDLWNQYIFPWKHVEEGKKIILYGYGKIGHIFQEQIKKTKYCEIVAICDQNKTNNENQTVPIIRIKDLQRYIYDYIVISVGNEKIVGEIKDSLLEAGVHKEKIVWDSYIR